MNTNQEPKKTVHIFMDLEFTGLRQNTSLVSIGCISECGAVFYAENHDYKRDQVDEWIQKNVIDNLLLLEKIDPDSGNYFWREYAYQNSKIPFKQKKSKVKDLLVAAYTPWMITGNLTAWLKEFGDVNIQFVVDCGQYDWVLFCELFEGSMNLPKNVSYVPFELATLFDLKGFNPELDRWTFIKNHLNAEFIRAGQHIAVVDALQAKLCYDILITLPWKK